MLVHAMAISYEDVFGVTSIISKRYILYTHKEEKNRNVFSQQRDYLVAAVWSDESASIREAILPGSYR